MSIEMMANAANRGEVPDIRQALCTASMALSICPERLLDASAA